MGGAGVGALPSGEPTCTGGRTQIIAALSYSTPSLPPSFTLLHALDQSTGKTDITPYTPFERPHLRHAAGIPTYTIKELGAKEAGGMFQVYARKGWGAQGESLERGSGRILPCRPPHWRLQLFSPGGEWSWTGIKQADRFQATNHSSRPCWHLEATRSNLRAV